MNIKHILFSISLFVSSFVHSMHKSDLIVSLPQVPIQLGAKNLTYGCEWGDEWTGDWCAKPFLKSRVKYWLWRGASIDCCSPDGLYTPLSLAARRADDERCIKLLESSADVNCAHAFYTPLAAAICRGYRKTIDLLLAHGADVNKASGRSGITPLMVAAYKGDSSTIELLLKKNADPLKVDIWGNNALMWAKDHPECMANFALCIAQFSPFLTFLCCLKQTKRLGSQKERLIADAMYQNRMKIWQAYIKIAAPFTEMLRHRNVRGRTAYDYMGGGKYIDDKCLLAILLRPSLECSVKERIALAKGMRATRLPSFPYVG